MKGAVVLWIVLSWIGALPVDAQSLPSMPPSTFAGDTLRDVATNFPSKLSLPLTPSPSIAPPVTTALPSALPQETVSTSLPSVAIPVMLVSSPQAVPALVASPADSSPAPTPNPSLSPPATSAIPSALPQKTVSTFLPSVGIPVMLVSSPLAVPALVASPADSSPAPTPNPSMSPPATTAIPSALPQKTVSTFLPSVGIPVMLVSSPLAVPALVASPADSSPAPTPNPSMSPPATTAIPSSLPQKTSSTSLPLVEIPVMLVSSPLAVPALVASPVDSIDASSPVTSPVASPIGASSPISSPAFQSISSPASPSTSSPMSAPSSSPLSAPMATPTVNPPTPTVTVDTNGGKVDDKNANNTSSENGDIVSDAAQGTGASSGVIVGLVVGLVGLVVAFILVCLLCRRSRRRGSSKTLGPLDTPAGTETWPELIVDSSEQDEVSTLATLCGFTYYEGIESVGDPSMTDATMGTNQRLLAAMAVGPSKSTMDLDEIYDEESVLPMDTFQMTAPPGRLGIVLEDSPQGTAQVRSIKPNSVLAQGLVQEGDILIRIDGVDVCKRDYRYAIKLLARNSDQERVLVFARD